MATENQLIKLEKIEEATEGVANRDIPETLSRGHQGYEKAIKSVMSAGIWAVTISIITLTEILIYLAYEVSRYYPLPLEPYQIALSVLFTTLSLTSGILGYKLWRLEATPQFVLISLIIILFTNLCCAIGILPLISAIITIIALTRFSTFCSWFRGIK